MPSRLPSPQRHSADGARRLSRRERRLLEWLAAGHAPQQVAHRLGRPERDVTERIGALLARFGVHSAAEALARAPAAAADDDEGDEGDELLASAAPAPTGADAAPPAADAGPSGSPDADAPAAPAQA